MFKNLINKFMPKAKKVAKKTTSKAKKPTSFKVVGPNGEAIRTYSIKVHGKKAEELAKMFCSKFPNYKIK